MDYFSLGFGLFQIACGATLGSFTYDTSSTGRPAFSTRTRCLSYTASGLAVLTGGIIAVKALKGSS